jgi:hypothetical protein
VDPSELRQVVLWVSQILIRYDRADFDETSFTFGGWPAAPPPPARTREQARQLAERIATEAQQHPGSFAELAAKFSEDLTTRQDGGSLGGTIASQFSPWPLVLDALAELHDGEVSRVVQTPYGFHVFQRRSPPAEATVSGARIVIGYATAHWLATESCRPLPVRSREEARELAADLYQRLQREPEGFSELAARYSEHCDAMQGGDFGAWSTRQPTHLPKQIEMLQRLAVGEIAAPMDTPLGFQIIRRTPERPRKQYAMDPIWLLFDPRAPETDPSSKAAVYERATALIASLRGDPAQFSRMKSQLWGGAVETWGEGSGEPPITVALDQVPMDGITPEPIPSGAGYVVAKRLDPASLPPAPVARFELPAPPVPDLQYFAASMDPKFFDAELHAVASIERDARPLLEPTASEFWALHDAWAPEQISDPEAWAVAFGELQSRIRRLLGEATYTEYRQRLDQHFESLVLAPDHASGGG